MSLGKYLSVENAAKLIGVTPSCVRQLIKAKKLKAKKVPIGRSFNWIVEINSCENYRDRPERPYNKRISERDD